MPQTTSAGYAAMDSIPTGATRLLLLRTVPRRFGHPRTELVMNGSMSPVHSDAERHAYIVAIVGELFERELIVAGDAGALMLADDQTNMLGGFVLSEEAIRMIAEELSPIGVASAA